MFEKIGLISLPPSRPAWMHSHAYIPCAFLLNKDTIRIILAFWDKKTIGRTGYLDVSSMAPLKLLGFSKSPSMDIGEPGAFDDNGISPLCLVRRDNGKLWMYYAGWQLNDKVRYLLYTGLAESDDDGQHFIRIKKTPVLERNDHEMIIRSGSFVYRDGNQWKMIYASGSKTIDIRGKLVPTYDFKLITSADGICWPDTGKIIFSPDVANKEFGFGRPCVLKENNIWKMWYGIRNTERGYSIGYGESTDGETWVRKDEAIKAFNNDSKSYDNETRSFPSLLTTVYGTYMFYNGNEHGIEGVCVAKLSPK